MIYRLIELTTVLLTSQAVVARLGEEQARNARTDPRECSNLVTLHEERMPTPDLTKVWEDFNRFHRGFVNLWYANNLSPGSLVEDEEQLFTPALTNDAEAIVWGQDRGAVPEFSIYNSSVTLEGEFRLNGGSGHSWRILTPPSDAENTLFSSVVLDRPNTDYILYLSFYFDEYQHMLIDHLGYIAYLRQNMKPNTRLIMADSGNHIMREILEELDPKFASKVDWVLCHNYKQCNGRVQIRGQGSTLRALHPVSSTRHVDLLYMARDWINQVYQPPPIYDSPTVIYYKRKSNAGAFHGRVMDPAQEETIIGLIQQALKVNRRPEKLVIFDGSLSFPAQVALFRSATIVIGPHGGGLANLIFTAQANDCDSRPKLLEFVTSIDTPEVQNGINIWSYHALFSTLPWMDYHKLLFVKPSNSQTTMIHMPTFRRALTKLFES